ncbi:MAG: 7-carboxy-7-deazaguanine synthase QueE [Peptococcaceae bacterium]|nr:7-carboxy-7-deazaguanine synthase QueE [Peptococcaceae bacterium]
MASQYPVNEIFNSIQGEGLWSGIPAAFIRLQGCNLRCPWCDTPLSQPEGAEFWSAGRILSQVLAEHVVITGGEPLLWDLTDLLRELTRRGKRIHIETNGTQSWREGYPDHLWLTVSPKRECGYTVAPSLIPRVSEYKLVVDEGFEESVLTRAPFNAGRPLLLSPEGVRPEMIRRAVALVLRYPHCRLTLQMHKLIGVR